MDQGILLMTGTEFMANLQSESDSKTEIRSTHKTGHPTFVHNGGDQDGCTN